MRGVITTRHLLIHGWTIVREFGFTRYVRCCVRAACSSRPVTFLECITDRF